MSAQLLEGVLGAEKVRLIDTLPPEEVEVLLHNIVDSICGCERLGVGFGVGNATASMVNAAELTSAAKNFIIAAIGNKWSAEEVDAALEQAQVSASSGIIKSVLAARGTEIRTALIERISSVFPMYLKDFDWSVRLVLSSSQMSQVRETLLLLTLTLKGVDPVSKLETQQEVKLELNQKELDSLIASLSAAVEAGYDYSGQTE